MKTLLIALGAAALLPVTAGFAQEVQFGVVTDSNSDGYYSYEEIKSEFPGATHAAVDRADTDGSGQVEAHELLRAVAKGYFVG